MFDKDRWQEIFYSIRKNKLRTFLSGFTITLGIFIFIVLFGISSGLQNGFVVEFIHGASNVIKLTPGRTSEAYGGLQANRNIMLENQDIEDISKKYGKNLEHEIGSVSKSSVVSYRNEAGRYSLEGTLPGKKDVKKLNILSGRFLNNNDVNNKSKYVVIGSLVQKDLFKRPIALGKYLNINGINYKVVGVFYDENGDTDNRVIYTPLSTIQLVHKNTKDINQINISYDPNMRPSKAVKLGEEIEKDIRAKYKLSPTDKTGLYVRNTAQYMERNFSVFAIISLLTLFIGFGTIIAGIIGISNIMVYIVKERTKEIGVRKALGAPPNNIVGLILQESIFITVIFGIMGALIAIATIDILEEWLVQFNIINPAVSWQLILTATISLITFGGMAGFIPARKASKIKPIEALRAD